MARNKVTGPGGYNVICDRCGFKFKNHQLFLEPRTQAMVCRGPGTNDCWDAPHPQEFVRHVRDHTPLPYVRPEPTDVELSFTPNCDALHFGYMDAGEINSVVSGTLNIYKVRIMNGPVEIAAGVTVVVHCDMEIE